MVENHFRHLPVVDDDDNGAVVGVVSLISPSASMTPSGSLRKLKRRTERRRRCSHADGSFTGRWRSTSSHADTTQLLGPLMSVTRDLRHCALFLQVSLPLLCLLDPA
jgi:hypothetical protein